jgi:KUP system potassium uptake protein
MIKGFGVFFDKAGETTPAVFTQFLSKLVAAPEVMVFFHLRPLETPSVNPEHRYTVSRLAIPNCYRVIVRHGYMDAVITPDLASLVCEQVRDFIIRGKPTPGPLARPPTQPSDDNNPKSEKMFISQAEEDSPSATMTQSPSSASDAGKISQEKEKAADENILKDVVNLQQAFDHKVLYIIGKEEMRIKPGTKIWRNVLLRAFLWIRDNTRTKIAALGVPTDRIVEVGFVKEV